MALTQQLALVPEGVALSMSELTKVSSALSKQVARDFGPIWSVKATVDAFATLEDVPTDYWPIIVTSHVGVPPASTKTRMVSPSRWWSSALSGRSPPATSASRCWRTRSGGGDPSEGSAFSYQVNGVTMSDFYTPDFFDPVGVSSVPYSFTGTIKAPRTVLRDGYSSWHDTVTDHWMQLRMFPDKLSAGVPHVVDLTTQTAFRRVGPDRA